VGRRHLTKRAAGGMPPVLAAWKFFLISWIARKAAKTVRLCSNARTLAALSLRRQPESVCSKRHAEVRSTPRSPCFFFLVLAEKEQRKKKKPKIPLAPNWLGLFWGCPNPAQGITARRDAGKCATRAGYPSQQRLEQPGLVRKACFCGRNFRRRATSRCNNELASFWVVGGQNNTQTRVFRFARRPIQKIFELNLNNKYIPFLECHIGLTPRRGQRAMLELEPDGGDRNAEAWERRIDFKKKCLARHGLRAAIRHNHFRPIRPQLAKATSQTRNVVRSLVRFCASPVVVCSKNTNVGAANPSTHLLPLGSAADRKPVPFCASVPRTILEKKEIRSLSQCQLLVGPAITGPDTICKSRPFKNAWLFRIPWTISYLPVA